LKNISIQLDEEGFQRLEMSANEARDFIKHLKEAIGILELVGDRVLTLPVTWKCAICEKKWKINTKEDLFKASEEIEYSEISRFFHKTDNGKIEENYY